MEPPLPAVSSSPGPCPSPGAALTWGPAEPPTQRNRGSETELIPEKTRCSREGIPRSLPQPPAGESHSLPRFWWVSELGRCQPSLAGSDPLLGGQAVGLHTVQCVLWLHRLPGAPEEGRPSHRHSRWASVWEAGKGLSLGRGGGSGNLCSLLRKGPGSPSRTLGLGSCQAQAPPPSLSHCHLSAGQGTRLWTFPSCWRSGFQKPMTGRPGHPEHP